VVLLLSFGAFVIVMVVSFLSLVVLSFAVLVTMVACTRVFGGGVYRVTIFIFRVCQYRMSQFCMHLCHCHDNFGAAVWEIWGVYHAIADCESSASIMRLWCCEREVISLGSGCCCCA